MTYKKKYLISFIVLALSYFLGVVLFEPYKYYNYINTIWKLFLVFYLLGLSIEFPYKFKLTSILLILINLLLAIVPLMTFNDNLISISNILFFIVLIFSISIFSTKDVDFEKENKDSELYLMLTFPIYFLIDCWKYVYNIISNFEKNDEVKTDKQIEKSETKKNETLLKFLQVTFGIAIGLLMLSITALYLSAIDITFFDLEIFELITITNISYSLMFGLTFGLIILIYKFKKNKYSHTLKTIILEGNSVGSKFSMSTSIILLFTLPLQLLFVIYEYSRLFFPEDLYGDFVANAFIIINSLVVFNLVTLLVMYFFYSNKQIFAKILRILLIFVNYLLLVISASQIITYINSFNALTHKRYFSLIFIFILILVNTIFLLKALNKNIVIIQMVYIVFVISVVGFFVIDADTIIYDFNTSEKMEQQSLENGIEIDRELIKSLDPRWKTSIF